jgi:maleate isomerase
MSIQTVKTPITLDKIAPRGRIGLISLATDFNIEQDLRRMLPEGFEIFTNRIKFANPTTIENLKSMEPDISRTAAGILPGLGVDAVLYACTSGTAAIGEDKVSQLVNIALPNIPVSNPFTAACQAFAAKGIKKISVLTPYIQEINKIVKEQFEARGFEILNIAGFGLQDDSKMTRISPQSIYQAAIDICHPQAQALFISCTALRASLVIEKIEQQLGKLILTSNQVSLWHLLKLLKSSTHPKITGFGQLLEQLSAN